MSLKPKKRILIVDDTYTKVEPLVTLIKEVSDCDIVHQMSSRDAVKELRTNTFDLMIVDLQIPSELGNPIVNQGGVELIEYCRDSDGLKKPTHILGVTSHQDCFDECIDFFNDNGWPLLLGTTNQERLKSIIQTFLTHSNSQSLNADVAIITALRKTELEAVLNLPVDWQECCFENDNNIYHLGTFDLEDGSKKTIVATSCSRMGMSAAAATTMKVCSIFSPKLLIMTGIAAGVEHKTEFGDILIADPCWDWGSGKLTVADGKPDFKSAPHQIPMKAESRSLFQEISTNRLYLDQIQTGWNYKNRPSSSLKLYVGPIASGAVVLEDPDTLKSIISQHRETIGVEMEAYGFAYAVSISGNKDAEAIVIKSVCDFANPDKNDNWQDYAAYTSAQLAYKYITNTANLF